MVERVIFRVTETMKAHWQALMPFALLVGVATTVIGAYFANVADDINAAVEAGETATVGEMTSSFFLGTLVVGMITAIVSAVIFNMVADADSTGTPDPGIAFQRTLERLPSLVGLVLLVGITIFIGLLFFILPGIYLGIALSPAIAVLFLEKKGALESFQRSRQLVSGRWWQAFGVVVVLVIFSLLIGLLGVPRGIIGLIGGVISAAILAVVQQTTILHLYHELTETPAQP